LSGWLSLFHDGSDSRIAGPAVSDALTGIFACLGILGALLEREKSGVGRKVEISMLEATMAFGAEPLGQYFATGVVPTRYSRGATSQAYLLECQDGKRIGLQLSSPPKFWESLAKATGKPELLTKYPDRRARISRYEEIARDLAEVFRTRTRSEWEKALLEHDVPFAPERKINELFDDPQVHHLDLLWKAKHPVHGEVKAMRRPVRFDGQRDALLRPPPDLGEHTEEVLREIGITADRTAELRKKRVI
jgi:crotonobetainyl-CoA:carnitine CoA-transferase CaiB-like acyl-CoA transferase